MRKIRLVLTKDEDLRAFRERNCFWHLTNRSNNTAVVSGASLRRGIVGCYLFDRNPSFTKDTIMTRTSYGLLYPWL